MPEWTRAELEAAHPDGTVNVQVDDDVRVMTTDEWDAWIESQVGTEKIDPPSYIDEE
jgi:trans-2-enoyl-CoA reductase